MRTAGRYAAPGAGGTMRALTAEPDNDVPGVDLSASPVTGTLDKVSDVDDVYTVYLEAGQRVSVAIEGAQGTDFDVLLFGPGTSTVYTLDGPLVAGATGSYPDAFGYNVPVSGTYYIDAYAYEGAGAYTLTYSVGMAVAVALGPDDDVPGVPPSSTSTTGTLDAGEDHDDVYSVSLQAGQTLVAAVTGAPGTDFDLYLYEPGAATVIDSPEWLSCAARASYPDELRYTAKTSGVYFLDVWAYKGAGDYRMSWTVKSRPSVGTPVAPRSVRRGARFKVSGRLSPRYPAGTYPVRIYRWRKTSSGGWKSYGFVRARAHVSGRYARTIALPRRGTWRLRAYATENASQSAAWSPKFDYVKVK